MEIKFLDKCGNNSTTEPLPRYLYKYYSNLDYVLNVIENRYIHLEIPSDYNDVFDSARVVDEDELNFVLYNNQYEMVVAKTECEYREQVLSLLRNCSCELTYIDDVCNYLIQGGIPYEIIKNMKSQICDTLKNAQPSNNKITCFTQKSDSLLMWAHYGNHLKGACLCFDTQKDPLLFSHAHNVEYTKFRNRERNYNFYFYKASEWKYEKEWRIVAQTQEDFIHTNSCVGVILGERTLINKDLKIRGEQYPYSNYLKVSCLAITKDLKVYKAMSNNSRYKIDIEETM